MGRCDDRAADSRRPSRVGADGRLMDGTSSPPAFWWYWQAGYKERWKHEGWGDTSLPRTFDEYFDEAIDQGLVAGHGPAPAGEEPRVLIECGGNMLRRTRGGKTALLPDALAEAEHDRHASTSA